MGKYTKEQILRKAISVISQYGFDSVTIRQIGKEVGLQGSSIYNYFESKDDILDQILVFIYDEITVYRLGTEELVHLLETQTPEEILRRFYTYYDDCSGELRQELYRILYMQMYRDDRFQQAVYRLIVKGPMDALESALRCMMDLGAIPPGDSRSLSEIWARTSIVFSIEDSNPSIPMNRKDYYDMQNFFLQMALRGVTPVPLEQMEFEWRFPARPPVEESGGTRDQILLSALRLFSQYGYNRVSMREIASDVGIKAGSIYNHFRSKEAILQDLINTFLSDYEAFTADNPAFRSALHSKNPTQIVLYLASPYPPVFTDRTYCMYRILFREHFTNRQLGEFFFSSINKGRRTIAKLLCDLEVEKRIAPCESAYIATAYVHTMVSLSLGASVEYPIVNESPLRLPSIALLVGLILNGYNYPPGDWRFRERRD